MVVIDILLAGAVTYAALSSERGVLIALVAACVCLVCWQVAVFLRARRGALALGIERNIRLPHYLQAGVQGCHYAYLGLYYPAVQAHLPLIAIQIVVFYAMEMLLQWSRGRNWRVGFGPLPVVGSINLFLWFEPEYFFGQLLLIAGALASREFVRWRRSGRSSHIFNPSAIALAAAAATTGINHILAFELPPSFFELMFVFGILLQIFFATTLVTFGAVLTFALIHYGGTPAPGRMAAVQRVPHQRLPGPEPAGHGPGDLAQVADAGKFLFGVTWGVAIWCCYVGLRSLDLPPYYDKILTVPLVNLLVPVFERAGRALAVSFRFDRAVYIAVYAGLFLLILPTLKLQYRAADYHLKDRLPAIASPEVWKSIPLVKEKRLFCELHRRACEPWGIAGELRLRYAVVKDIDRLRKAAASAGP